MDKVKVLSLKCIKAKMKDLTEIMQNHFLKPKTMVDLTETTEMETKSQEDTITSVETDLTKKATTEMIDRTSEEIAKTEAITTTAEVIVTTKIVVKIVKINHGLKTQIQTSDCIINTTPNSISM